MKTKYGLPLDINFCNICGMSNQKVTPSRVQNDTKTSTKNTLKFKNGTCGPCQYNLQKQQDIDWKERRKHLEEICNQYRSNDGSYDCIVPGSGGKDSVYQSYFLKNEMGMNPITVTWAPHMYTEYGWRNFQRWISEGDGFSNFLYTANGRIHRSLTSLAYKNLLHPFQPFIFGQRNYVMHMARQLNIGLIVFGENPADYGGFDDEETHWRMDPMYYVEDNRDDILVSGLSLGELQEEHCITENDLRYYLPLRSEQADDANLNPIWLGYFTDFHPQGNYYFAKEKIKFEPNNQRTEGTYSRYNSLDDKLDGLHYWTGYVKFGVGRAMHEACQEVRNGDLIRDEAIALIRKYDGEFPQRYLKEILEYMKIDHDEFFSIADSFRSDHLFHRENKNGKWLPRFEVK